MKFDDMYRWEKLEEIKGMSFKQFNEWLKVNGLEEAEAYDENSIVYIDGYYADLTPIVKFENGKVACWYRGGYWD